ncbi:MAG TPA: hypothetical protein VGP61_11220 [Gemmatimonadales bacterium]|jgi:hypothetical protein|nr:hypothetical protein [Gemmatimonadales bacterium]
MSGKGLFGVVVRALGLWILLRGIADLLTALVSGATVLRGGWLWGGLYLLGGLFLLRAAAIVVRFAYGAADEG